MLKSCPAVDCSNRWSSELFWSCVLPPVSTSHPPDITQVMNETRPFCFCRCSASVYYCEHKQMSKSRRGLWMKLHEVHINYITLVFWTVCVSVWLSVKIHRICNVEMELKLTVLYILCALFPVATEPSTYPPSLFNPSSLFVPPTLSPPSFLFLDFSLSFSSPHRAECWSGGSWPHVHGLSGWQASVLCASECRSG